MISKIRLCTTLSFCAILTISLSFNAGVADDVVTVRILQNNALEINGQKVILFGVSIPVAKAKCFVGGKQWPCGASATLRLDSIFKEYPFSCDHHVNFEQKPFVRCSNSQYDIALQLVLEGWAIAVAESEVFLPQERKARIQRVGIWRDGFIPPENWRTYPDITFDPIEDLLCSSCAVRKQ